MHARDLKTKSKNLNKKQMSYFKFDHNTKPQMCHGIACETLTYPLIVCLKASIPYFLFPFKYTFNKRGENEKKTLQSVSVNDHFLSEEKQNNRNMSAHRRANKHLINVVRNLYKGKIKYS